MRRTRTLVATAFISLALGACGQSGPAGSNATTTAQATTTATSAASTSTPTATAIDRVPACSGTPPSRPPKLKNGNTDLWGCGKAVNAQTPSAPTPFSGGIAGLQAAIQLNFAWIGVAGVGRVTGVQARCNTVSGQALAPGAVAACLVVGSFTPGVSEGILIVQLNAALNSFQVLWLGATYQCSELASAWIPAFDVLKGSRAC